MKRPAEGGEGWGEAREWKAQTWRLYGLIYYTPLNVVHFQCPEQAGMDEGGSWRSARCLPNQQEAGGQGQVIWRKNQHEYRRAHAQLVLTEGPLQACALI